MKRYYEIDFAEITRRKRDVILLTPALRQCIGLRDDQTENGGDTDGLQTSAYCLLSGDLRRWNDAVVPKLLGAGFDAQ